MGRPGRRAVRIWAAATVAIAVLGPLAGVLWAWLAPPVHYVVVDGRALLAQPESQAMIGVDGRFAVITALAGVGCGVLAYLAGGRDNDVALVLGLAAGGLAAALLTWRVGHLFGLDAFERAVRDGADGRAVDGPAELRAKGALVFWPLVGVACYGLLETAIGRLAAGDGRGPGAGEADEVGGGQLDLQAAPAGGDKDRSEP